MLDAEANTLPTTVALLNPTLNEQIESDLPRFFS